MASKRFTCKNCGYTFEGDLSTRTCCSCGSSDIKVKKGGGIAMPKWVKIVTIAVAIIILIILLLKGCGGSDKLTVRKIEDGVSVKIEASGVNKNRLKDYKVQMLLGTDVLDTKKFNSKSGLAVFPYEIMLENTCYNFRVVYKDGKPVENIHWITSTQCCPPESPTAPVIVSADPTGTDRDKKVYTVTIIIADSSNADSYSLLPDGIEPSDDSWQSDNVFKNIKPGSYTAYAKNGMMVGSYPKFYKDIKELPKELTLPEVQKILDAVCAGTMNPSVAQDKLADGSVDLANPVISEDGGTISTLFNVLTEASQGVCFKVNSFQNDPNTNKIKSGSLNISLQ